MLAESLFSIPAIEQRQGDDSDYPHDANANGHTETNPYPVHTATDYNAKRGVLAN